MITAPRRTKQEAFDLMWTSIIAQGKPSMDRTRDACRYTGSDGTTHCAIGWLFEPEDRARLHQGSISTNEANPNIEGDDHRHFAGECQNAHDDAAFDHYDHGFVFLERFQSKMRALAARWNLKVPQ